MMQRRRYLSLSGVLLAGLAGCSGDSDDMSEGGENGGTENTEVTTSSPTPNISIESTEIIPIETSFDDTIGAEIVITNDGNATKPNFKTGVDWLDADDRYISTSNLYGEVLEDGETWNARIEARSAVDNPEQIDGVEATLTDNSPFGEYDIYPEGVELTESTLRASDDGVVVRGVIENNRMTSEFLRYVAKVYNNDEEIIGIGTGFEEVAGEDSWRFEATPDTYGRDGQVESAKVVPVFDL